MCFYIGRGRAKDSKCILVTSKTEVVENEKYNRHKEEMMNEAIEKLQNWDETTFARTVCTSVEFSYSTGIIYTSLHLQGLYLGPNDNLRKVFTVFGFRPRLDQQRKG